MEPGAGGWCDGLMTIAVVGGTSAAVMVTAACGVSIGGVGGVVWSIACDAVSGLAGGDGFQRMR